MHTFQIPGKPRVQKQTMISRGRFYDPSYKDRLYIQEVANQYRPSQILQAATVMDLTFFRPIPKSASKALTQKMLDHVVLPTTRPDVDNYAYLVTNALKEIFYSDDSLVTDLNIRKRYSETPCTLVKIWEYFRITE